MADLIDRDALLEEAHWIIRSDGTRVYAVHVEDVENAPTIDAVPVVQCKDCRYKYMAKVNDKGFLICPASGMEITDDDFCSYGERRTDEI